MMNEQIPNTEEKQQFTQPPSSQSGTTFEQFLKEVAQFALDFGLAAGKAAENITGLMILPVNPDLRGKMDDLVEAGLAKNRGEAALMLMRDGIASNQGVLQQVEKTRTQIQALRSQLRSMIGQQS